ncbi:MAG: nucleotidyltransferase family protein [Bacteroidota bacterium]
MSLVETLETLARVDFASPAATQARARVLAQVDAVLGRSRFAVSWLDANKVVPIAYHNIDRLGDPRMRGLASALEQEWGAKLEASQRARELRAELQAISPLLAGLRVMLVKGTSLWYLVPDTCLRAQNDIDVVAPDTKTVWEVVRRLSRAGYSPGRVAPWIQMRRSIDGDGYVVAGSITLERQVPGRPWVCLDIHWPSMPVGIRHGYLEPDWFWDDARRLDNGFYVPSPENALLVTLAHAHQHGYVIQKDVNDVYLIVSTYENYLDWDYIMHHVRLLRMTVLYDFLAEKVSRLYGVPLRRVSDRGATSWLARRVLFYQYRKPRHIAREIGVGPLWAWQYLATRLGARRALDEVLADVWFFAKKELQYRTTSDFWLNFWFNLERRRSYVAPFSVGTLVFLAALGSSSTRDDGQDLDTLDTLETLERLCRSVPAYGFRVHPMFEEGFVGVSRGLVEMLVSVENVYLAGPSLIVTDTFMEEVADALSTIRDILQGSGESHTVGLDEGGEADGNKSLPQSRQNQEE